MGSEEEVDSELVPVVEEADEEELEDEEFSGEVEEPCQFAGGEEPKTMMENPRR